MNIAALESATRTVRADGDASALRITAEVSDGRLRSVLTNRGTEPIAVREVVVASLAHDLAPDTPLYGEGYQMLSQYEGTVSERISIGRYDDAGHYRLPEPGDGVTVYNLALVSGEEESVLLAFTTCEQFAGQVRIGRDRVEAVVLTEGLTLAPDETWELEEVALFEGPSDTAVLAELGRALAARYPVSPPPTELSGWCSWYWFLDELTTEDVLGNATVVTEQRLDLRFVQIDDGYEDRIGDWFRPHPGVAPVAELFAEIRARGAEPAIWVSPFIAEPSSAIVRDHPDWFVARADGSPLPSDEVTFGGWREPAWLMLDGSHPEALDHLRGVFQRMRDEWDCRYFKLDALAWGAFPFGVRHDPGVSSVTAYRRAMAVIREAVGPGSVLLGCNAPMWPSLGLVDAMRTSGDIDREWAAVRTTAKENIRRSWQHGRLWQTDPDCVLLVNKPGRTPLSREELDFHAAAIIATGGSLFAGDDLRVYDEAAFDRLRLIASAQGGPAVFAPDRRSAVRAVDGEEWLILLNDEDAARVVALPEGGLTDVLTGAPAESAEGRLTLAPRSGRVLRRQASPADAGAQDPR